MMLAFFPSPALGEGGARSATGEGYLSVLKRTVDIF